MAELLVAIFLVGVVVLALYGALNFGTVQNRMVREDLRAMQILQQKAEAIRVSTWNQINTGGYLPTSFTAYFDPTDTNGTSYAGSISVVNASSTTSYKDELKLITITLNWKTGNLDRQRQLKTYVSRNGLSQYVN